MTLTRLRATIAAPVFAVLLLSGCAPDAAAPVTEPPASITPTPTDTSTPVVTTRPAAQIPVTCDELWPEERRLAAARVPVTRSTSSSAFFAALREQQGDLSCDGEGKNTRLIIDVSRNADARFAPLDLGGEDMELDSLGADISGLHCFLEGDVTSYCMAQAILGDYYIYSYVNVARPELTNKQLLSMAHALIDPAIALLADQPEPALWAAPSGSWPLLSDCEAIEADGHVDVPELLSVLGFTPVPVPYLAGIAQSPGLTVFRPPVPDFELLHVTGSTTLPLRAAAIALCTEGSFTLGSFTLARGESVYITADEAPVQVAGEGELFVATSRG